MTWEAPHKKPLWIDPDKRGKVDPATFERVPTEFWYSPYLPIDCRPLRMEWDDNKPPSLMQRILDYFE